VLQGVTADLRGRGVRDGREHSEHVRDESELDVVSLAVEVPRRLRANAILAEDGVAAVCADQLMIAEGGDEPPSADPFAEEPLGQRGTHLP
jgi:hypothetical protein